MRAFQISIGLVLLGVATSPSSAAEPSRVVLIGDSITAGKVSGEAGPGYADVLAVQLGAAYVVSNQGCGGSRLSDWRPDSPAAICGNGVFELWEERVTPNLPAELVTVMLGTNDATGFLPLRPSQPVPVEEYAAALSKIVNALRDAGARRVLLMTPPPRCETASKATLDRLKGYRREVLATCATTPEVVCGPDAYALLDPAEHFEACDAHPNATGHATLGKQLAHQVKKLPVRQSSSWSLRSWFHRRK